MKTLNGKKLFVGGLVLFVAAAIVYGFYLVGSPTNERARRFDAERVAHLQQIANSTQIFYQQKKRLPSNIGEMMTLSTYLPLTATIDPETQAPYEYRVTGPKSYELCATFNFSSKENENERGAYPSRVEPFLPPGVKSTLWDHPPGHHCFMETVQEMTDMGCTLMREAVTGRVDCFGCANGICKDPASGWQPFVTEPGAIGIPYACYSDKGGCALAQ